jgi:hypothetical protein
VPPEPNPGEMVLHPEIRPLLTAGRRQLTVQQTFTVDDANRPVQTEVHHLEVTGPRVTMPGTELFSVTPPPNAEGAFAGRLAQVALRRRTLPWERSTPPSSGAPAGGPPWLALVILTDEEGAFCPGVPTAEAFTDGVAATLEGLDDAPATCDALEVLDDLVARTFPAREELSALCHVRQVSLADTEYADEDGFVSVVICNRLPQPDTRYAAFLISLEGQHHELPEPGQVQPEPGPTWAFETILQEHRYTDVIATWHRIHDVPLAVTPEPLAAATGPSAAEPAQDLTVAEGSTALPLLGGAPSAADDLLGLRREAPGARRAGSLRGGSTTEATGDARADGSVVAVAPGLRAYQGLVAMGLDHRVIGDLLRPDPRTLRFPVLAHWEFTCTAEDRDFRAYLTGVDIGLLGEGSADPPEDARPLDSVETGHLPLEHVDRSGRRRRSWYRGPFTPTRISRGVAAPLHHADQARVLVPGPDGVSEDLGYAAAFELGRLLAMADLAFVRGVRDLVGAGFRQPRDLILPDRLGDLLDIHDLHHDLGYLRDLSQLLTFAALLPGPLGPAVTPGFGTTLPTHDLATLLDPDVAVGPLATGLGLPAATVAEVLGATLTGAPSGPVGVDRPGRGFDDLVAGAGAFEHLHEQLTVDVADRLQELATGERLLAEAGREDRLADLGLPRAADLTGASDALRGSTGLLVGEGAADVLTRGIRRGELAIGEVEIEHLGRAFRGGPR